ncbi:hypothetical protein JYU08_00805 [bacterium AH-315-B06]|nr:hypothetical protein [bacterium AH-315-B06]
MNTDRRAVLERAPNPAISLDYLTRLDGMATNVQARITVRYIPGKDILTPHSFLRYLGALGDDTKQSLEQLVIIILNDFNNEIVPRWVQIRVARHGAGEPDHHVLIEDRQPKWDNPALLARLEGF